jgi:hypothetical protein
MVITEVRRSVVAVAGVFTGPSPWRGFRVRVVFPDIGLPFVSGLGSLRYPGEPAPSSAEPPSDAGPMCGREAPR